MPKNKLEMTPLAETANKGNIHLVKYCIDQYEKIEQSAYRKKTLEEIKASVDAYEQEDKATADMWDGESKVTLPLTTISCDNLEPRLVAGLVGKKPYVHLEMENDQKQDEETEILETFYNNELEDVVKVELRAGEIVHQLMQEGTVYPMPSYDLDEVTRKDFILEDDLMEYFKRSVEQGMLEDVPQEATDILAGMMQSLQSQGMQLVSGVLMGPDGPILQDKQESVFEGGKIDIVPFHDIFVADDVDDWEKAVVIRKIYPTYAGLVQDSENKPGYQNIGPWLVDETNSTTIEDDNLTAAQRLDAVRESGKKTIECIECYVSYIYRDDDAADAEDDDKEIEENYTEERLVATITLDSGILVRLMPLRELNFKNEHLIKRIRLFPRRGKSFGTSIYGKMKAIQEGASKTFNMAINVAEVCLIPWFFYESESGLAKNKDKDGKPGMRIIPGMGVKVDSVKGLLFPQFPINPDHFINWINLWVQFWERLLSIGDLQVGRQGEKDRTATETMAVIQEGNVKHNYQSQSIKDDFLTVLRTIFDLYYQNMPFDKTFLWNGEEKPIPRSMMQRPVKFRLTGSTDQSNKLIERREKENFYQFTREDPNINPVKRAEELVKSYGYSDTGEWVFPNIAMIVEKIMTVPGADKLVAQAIGEAEQMAAQMEAQAKEQQKNIQQQRVQ